MGETIKEFPPTTPVSQTLMASVPLLKDGIGDMQLITSFSYLAHLPVRSRTFSPLHRLFVLHLCKSH